MGTTNTYYFAPPALPWNPNLTRTQLDRLSRFGRNNAKWFDRFGFDYFTRENYDSFKEYIITPGNDPNRAGRMAALLRQSGIEIRRAGASFTNPKTRDYDEGALQSREFPAGSCIVSLAQPAKRLVKTLMDSQFLNEQRRRNERRELADLFRQDVRVYTSDLEFTRQNTVFPAGSLIKLDKGTNVAVYLPAARMFASGFMWDDARRQMPNKAYLIHSRLGRGNVIGFAEDPNYRAFMDGLNLFLINAIFLGPGH